MNDREDRDCPICGAYLEWVRCWYGCDDGFFYPYLPGVALERCEECHGRGGYLECSNLPHTEQATTDAAWEAE